MGVGSRGVFHPRGRTVYESADISGYVMCGKAGLTASVVVGDFIGATDFDDAIEGQRLLTHERLDLWERAEATRTGAQKWFGTALIVYGGYEVVGAKLGAKIRSPRGPGGTSGTQVLVVEEVSAAEAASGQNTVVRYVGRVEAQIAEESGFIPNTNRFDAPKTVFVTPEAPLASACEVESVYQMGSPNPFGATATPTHVIIGDAKGITFNYGGIVEGGTGVEMTTTQPIPVIKVQPIGRP